MAISIGMNSVYDPSPYHERPPFPQSVKHFHVCLAKTATSWDFRMCLHVFPITIFVSRKQDMYSWITVCSFYYYIIWDQFVCDEFACYWSCRKCPSCCDMVQVLNRLYLGSYCVRLILWRPNVHVTTEAIKVFQNLFKVTSSQAIIVFPSAKENKRHLEKIKNHLSHR